MRYDERPGKFFPGLSLHGSTRRATSPYGTPCPDSSVIAEAGGLPPRPPLNTRRCVIRWPGGRAPSRRNTRMYGSPLWVIPLAFLSRTPLGSPRTMISRWVSTTESLMLLSR